MEEWRRFGDFLRAERELRKVPLEEVAEETKIPVQLLLRLEEGRRDGMPPEIFVRGFVRAYARCVGLPVDEVDRRHDRLLDLTNARPPEPRSWPRERASATRRSRILLALILAAAIATITLSLI